MKRTFLLAASGLVLASSLAVAIGSARQDPPKSADPYRQFDFWVGDWECYDGNNQLNGTNSITLECNGRVLQEHWVGTGGGPGTSLNIYDAQTKQWHQTWVDSGGTLLLLDGGLEDDSTMIMEGKRPAAGGGEVLHRVVWAPVDGDVQQTWTMSADGGETWRTLADLTYKRVVEETPAEDKPPAKKSD